MRLRRLNQAGLDRFAEFLDSLTGDAPMQWPVALLTDDGRTEPVEPETQVKMQRFASRMELAAYLDSVFQSAGLSNNDRDQGLWAWLSLFFFEQLCPRDAAGVRRPGERARWILNTASRRYYRHLLAGPYLVYRLHADAPERLQALLCGPVHQTSDVFLEIADSPQLVTNPAVLAAATRLYYDPQTGRPKRGTGRDAPGGARRMAEVLAQFDCTWDLYSMSEDDLLRLLPAEFDPFRSPQAQPAQD